jgi:hypothetical protein
MTHSRFTRVARVALPLVCWPASGVAQRLPTALQLSATDSNAIHRHFAPTYWQEGATIGAAVVGTTGAWIAYDLACKFSDTASDCRPGAVIAGGLVAGVVGGIAGGLAGGAFSARQPRPLRGHPVKATLVGAGVGALWSFGLFWHLCVNGCRSEQVAFGLSSTAIGALAGLLVGH